MNRRRLLALCGTVLATPGCVSMSNGTVGGNDAVTPAPPPDTGTDDESNTRGTAGSVSVTDATVQQGVVGPDSPDSIGVFDDAEQYLVVTVAVDGPAPEREAFQLRADGDRVQPAAFGNGLYRGGDWGVRYDADGGPLVFPLPETVAGDGLRLEWPGGSWTPTEQVRTRLAAPLPPFAVSLDGPTRVDADDDPRITVDATNVGEVPGRFVLALNRSGPRVAYAPVGRITGVLDPGESWSATYDAERPYAADPPHRATYLLDAPGDRQDETLRISPADTESGTDSGTGTAVR
jgi:hypothetical protein